MLKRAVKSTLRSLLLSYHQSRTAHSVIKRDKAIVKSHPEWEGLTPHERAQIRDKDYWQYVAYKNVRGNFGEGFVSDLLYWKILHILNPANYTASGANILDHNLFGNKNYFALLLKYLAMPKTVIMCINGELMDSSYSLITKEAALGIMNSHPQLVFKPAAGTGHGTHVSLVERKDFSEAMSQYAKYTDGGGGLHCSGSSEAA